MSKIGVLNTIPEAPVKPLMQPLLETYPDAVLVNPFGGSRHSSRANEVDTDMLMRANAGTFDRLIHDGDWLQMSKVSKAIIRQALESGVTIQIVNRQRGEV